MSLSTRDRLTIGELAARSGNATSALRYYEELGLIQSERTAGGQRRYRRATLRWLAFVRAAQRIGLSLGEVRDALAHLPVDHVPSAADWSRVARTWQHRIDEQIAELQQVRDQLTGCVGCGCLSLTRCGLYNPEDTAARRGSGARYLLGDEPLAR
ncbi:MerR family transcriptional regulator, redox-sensitive transcriptional activator SoxR [Actinacidiphila yanglinensis]|uniref:MerR family transcriptional regulator, redox-sensitive transcriptional activator SoxR n=1 Tax=Actinacidiphila yanglinensis TaxID=310779 RepID=A0A1H5Y2S2_9ACTN|nr:redox-sensitive transcriptional activator SoxR [Actinacidiphila yanglinensis]SEG18142.1 MerR family transcriptional regulator, redox-sensitive transcriptional activator SoxR [Actinacidiphila yanglinensis]